MTMKMHLRAMAAVAAGVLAAALLAGCNALPQKKSEETTAADTALILTQGDGMPALTDPDPFLESVSTTLGGSAGLVIADGAPQVYGPIRFDRKKQNEVQQAKTDRKMRTQIAEIVKGAVAQTPETDLITAVSLAGRMVSSGTAEQKQIIIRHSGVNTASTLPMQELDLPNADSAQLVDQLDAAAMIPQLDGITVEFYGLGDVAGSQEALSAQQVKWLQNFWQAFFDRAGAAVTFHTDIVSGPAMTDGGHTVTPVAAAGTPSFITVSAEQVAFRPDSTALVDEPAAQAVLNSLAQQMQDSGVRYVVAGSTAKVDNATSEGAQSLSLARAQVVRQMLVETGVSADRLICVGLGNEATSCRSADEASNRCVYIVADGVPQATEFLAVGMTES